MKPIGYNINIRIGDHWFLIHPKAVARALLPLGALAHTLSGDYIPVTVLPACGRDCRKITTEDIEQNARDFELRDDVWSRSFLAGKGQSFDRSIYQMIYYHWMFLNLNAWLDPSHV